MKPDPLSHNQIESIITDEKTFSSVYKFLLQHTHNPIWICDPEGTTIFVNNHFSQLTGFKPDDIVGKPSLQFFEEKYHQTIKEERKTRAKGLISSIEVQFKTKHDAFIPIKLTAYPLPNGGTIGIITDLSAHSTADDELFRTIIESMDDGTWVGDGDDTCTYANPSMCNMLGYTHEELERMQFLQVVPEEWQEMVKKEVSKRAFGKISTYQIDLITKSGDMIPVEITGSPLPDKDGTMAVIKDLRNAQKEASIYKSLIDNMNEAVWLRGSDGELEYANHHFCKLVGYSLDELVGDTAYKYWADEHVARVKKEQEARKDGISSVYRGTVKKKDGNLVPVLVSASPTLDGGSFGILTDLSDLLSKEYMFQSLIENMNEAIWMGGTDGRTTYVNPQFCELTGYTEDQILEKYASDFWEETLTQGFRSLHSFDSHQSTPPHEAMLHTSDGSKIPILLSTTSGYQGGIICLVTDLREMKKKEREMKKKDQYLSAVTEHSADGIISTDLNGHVKSWNRGAEKIFGYSKEEVMEQDCKMYFPQKKKDSGEAEHINKEVIRKGFVKDFRTQRLHKEGHLIDVSITQSAILDDRGECIGYSIIYRDISLQKKWEEELNLRFENLKNAYLELGKKGRHMDYFIDLLDTIVGNIEINNVTDFIIGATAMITKVDACTLRIYNEETGLLDLVATNGVTAEWYNKGSHPYAGSLEERAFNDRKITKILDLNREARYRSQKLAMKQNLHSMLVIPLYIKDEFLGGLKLYISKESKFELLDNEFIENFAKLASIALKLRKLSRD